MKKYLKIICVVIMIGIIPMLFMGCGSSKNVPQKGWDLYAGDIKDVLEKNLRLEYVWIKDPEVSSGEAVYYKGSYGSYTSAYETENTTFYFVYDVEKDDVEEITKYVYTLALELAEDYDSSKGVLIS